MAIDPATSASWRIKPLPEQRAPLPYERRFSAAEHARLVQGLVPVQMEDKWFIYLQDGLLRFHRSATGTCIYGVRLAIEPATEGGSAVTEAWVSRAPGEYTRTDDAYDARLLSFLVERLLLGAREVPFPVPDAIVGGDKASLYRHHVVGHARAADEEP
jgi:hypothetical protein